MSITPIQVQLIITSLQTLYSFYNYYSKYSGYIFNISNISNISFLCKKSNDHNKDSNIDYEKELENTQMDMLLKWMGMVFNKNKDDENKDDKDNEIMAYKQELYNIYVTIRGDYSQYLERKKHNSTIWVFSSYRKKNTKELAKKIMLDIQLFYDGLKMFSLILG